MKVFAKKIVGRKETLEYANRKFDWPDGVIGVSCWFGVWSWLYATLTGRKCIYYCIDFYSPKIAKNWLDRIFIYLAMLVDRFLVNSVDKVWDISRRINYGRVRYGRYYAKSTIVPLSYPKSYFRYSLDFDKNKVVFVGLDPYGLEIADGVTWLGHDKLLELDDLLDKLSHSGIGISLWKDKGNNYYGDPGKTKLYSACGLPVIMTDNTPYAAIIKKTGAGIVVNYDKEDVKKAIQTIKDDYWTYKYNTLKTWDHINADSIFKDPRLLEF